MRPRRPAKVPADDLQCQHYLNPMGNDLRIGTILPPRMDCSKFLAAVWFGAFAPLASAALFRDQAMMAVFTALVLPSVSAAIVGYVWGAPLLDAGRTKSLRQAVIKGLWLTLAIYALFTLLLVLSYFVPAEGGVPDAPTLTAAYIVSFAGGLFVTAPVIFMAGAIGAIGLYVLGQIASQARSRRS